MSVASFTLFGIRIQKFEFHPQQEKVLIHGNYPSRENFTSNVDKLVLHKEQPTMPPKKSKVKKPSKCFLSLHSFPAFSKFVLLNHPNSKHHQFRQQQRCRP
mmetsp:Transcript_14681/g.30946  ORF Transcript_14681/g.30946 Transcript_14681/m.30946 type:complete len:101 (+) Transcript_14681:241-543(+)